MVTYPTVVQAASFTTAAGTGGPRIDIDYRMQLIKQRESAAPFLALMLQLNSQATQTHIFRGFETRPNPKRAVIAALVAAVAAVTPATVTCVAGEETRFNVGDIVIPKLGVTTATHSCVGFITAVDKSAHTLTIQGNDTSLGWTGIAASDTLQVWGNSKAQGMLSAVPSGTVPALKTFYTGISKHGYRVDKTQANNRLYGAPERDRLRGEKEIEHLIELEKQLLRGDGTVDLVTDTSPRTNMTGVMNQFTTNTCEYGATLDGDTLFAFMTSLHAPKYATDGKMSRRMVIASSDVLNMVNKIALAKNQNIGVVTQYGMDVFKTVWMGRTWDWVEDPILSDFMPGYAVVFHPRYVRIREFRPTRLEANIQPNNADYYEDQFLTELGCEVYLEELGGIIKP